MPTWERATVVPAPFDTVWDFHDHVEGLQALTPDWMGLDVRRVVAPDGTPDPEEYRVGTRIKVAARPFGLDWVPPVSMVVEITEREVEDDRGYFVDEQIGNRGPFTSWRHRHRFVGMNGETVIHDRITYSVPGPGDPPVATPFLAAILWYRHRLTRDLLAE